MRTRQIFFSLLLGGMQLSASANALDVYQAQTPAGCLEKNISVKEEVSLIDLIKIGICNNPGLNVDYMSLKSAEANLGSAKSEYFPDITLNAGANKNTRKLQGYSRG